MSARRCCNASDQFGRPTFFGFFGADTAALALPLAFAFGVVAVLRFAFGALGAPLPAFGLCPGPFATFSPLHSCAMHHG